MYYLCLKLLKARLNAVHDDIRNTVQESGLTGAAIRAYGKQWDNKTEDAAKEFIGCVTSTSQNLNFIAGVYRKELENAVIEKAASLLKDQLGYNADMVDVLIRAAMEH